MDKKDLEYLRQWIGRSETAEDMITPGLVRRFQAMLSGKVVMADAMPPPCLHWCLGPPAVPEEETGPDGHPTRGGFLPPVPLERRLWGGGNIEFVSPLETGDHVHRKSTIASVDVKQGKSGEFVVVGIDHVHETSRGIAIRERQDIIYSEMKEKKDERQAENGKVASAAAHSNSLEATTLFMFRYSALTFNGHRIHYDRKHAMEREGYPGLVFHGPLQATLLAIFASHTAGLLLKQFSYRGVAPLFGGDTFTINAQDIDEQGKMELWCANSQGRQTMLAIASFR